MRKGTGRRTVSGTDGGTVERTVPGTEELDISLREAEAYENIERIRSELGDDEGYVLLSRRMQNGQLATLAKINASIFDVDYIIKKFGGGNYSARFYKSGVALDDGGFLGSVPFVIDPSVIPEPDVPTPPVQGNGEGTLVVLVQQMLSELKELRKAPVAAPVPAPDPMAMIKAIGETMKALTPAPLPPPPPAPPAPGLKEQLEMIKSVVDVGTTILDARGESGGGGSGDAYMETVGKLAEPIIDLVKARAQQEALRRPPQRGALPPGRNTVTPPVAATAAVAPNPPTGDPAMSWIVELQRWMPMIVTRARKGLSAEDTAFFICDELSEATQKKLAELAALPDFAARAGQILPPELQGYPEWVGEFLSAVQDYLFGDEQGEVAGGDEPPESPGGQAPLDLDAKAERTLAALDDAPTKEPVPVP